MGLFETSPIQEHEVRVVTEVFWAQGTLESRGDPHNYLNQDDFEYLQLNDAHVDPWRFTGLPGTGATKLTVARERIQMLLFTEETTMEAYRRPPQTAMGMFYFPLFVVRGEAPLLGDTQIDNFLDMSRSTFIPLTNASLHFLSEGAGRLPAKVLMCYVNRHHMQGYFGL
jgi:hypothetical protein